MDVDAIREREFHALRDTIRERGTTRMLLVAAACLGWGALAVAVMLVAPVALLLLLPLVVLAAGFELNAAVHRGVERMGRYVQVAFEERLGSPGWETVSLEFASRFAVKTPDPLFFWVFSSAVVGNFVCVLLTNAEPTDLGVVTVLHGALMTRFVIVRKLTETQRRDDLATFREILGRSGPA